MLVVHNTLTRTKEEFIPHGSRVNLFVCGPTVYSKSHIGHARTYIFFDVLVKYLRSQGMDIFYLQNITDIDDKIIHRAQELGKDALKLSEEEMERYFADMKSIKVDAVTKYAPASKYIPEIITQIEALITKGHAYASGGSVYYDITSFPDFGKLSHQNLEALQKAERTEDDSNKKHPHDFVVWRGRAIDSGEPTWESPWGPGRPGWHIEDTAIAQKELGEQYDMHGGGLELIFPHHEAEIAQAEGMSGKKPYVRYWIHTGWVTAKGEKMSKSLGNFLTIEDILKNYSPEALRLLMLQTHYRSPLEYSEELIQAAENSMRGIKHFEACLNLIRAGKMTVIPHNLEKFPSAEKVINEIESSMNNDFNTTEATSHFFAFLNEFYERFGWKAISREDIIEATKLSDYMKNIFGIIPALKEIPPEVREKADEREKLRAEKKWQEADMLRNEIASLGFEVSDTPYGSVLVDM
jgi:cysteinyl-tRNA synthetase